MRIRTGGVIVSLVVCAVSVAWPATTPPPTAPQASGPPAATATGAAVEALEPAVRGTDERKAGRVAGVPLERCAAHHRCGDRGRRRQDGSVMHGGAALPNKKRPPGGPGGLGFNGHPKGRADYTGQKEPVVGGVLEAFPLWSWMLPPPGPGPPRSPMAR